MLGLEKWSQDIFMQGKLVFAPYNDFYSPFFYNDTIQLAYWIAKKFDAKNQVMNHVLLRLDDLLFEDCS